MIVTIDTEESCYTTSQHSLNHSLEDKYHHQDITWRTRSPPRGEVGIGLTEERGSHAPLQKRMGRKESARRGRGREREREREEKRRETFARSFAREKSDTHRSQKPLPCSPIFSIFFFSISRMQFMTNLQVVKFLELASFIPMSSYLQHLANRGRRRMGGLGQRYEYNSGVVDGAFFSARSEGALRPLLSIVSREIEKERKENNEPNAFIHFLKISSNRRTDGRRNKRTAECRQSSM